MLAFLWDATMDFKAAVPFLSWPSWVLHIQALKKDSTANNRNMNQLQDLTVKICQFTMV